MNSTKTFLEGCLGKSLLRDAETGPYEKPLSFLCCPGFLLLLTLNAVVTLRAVAAVLDNKVTCPNTQDFRGGQEEPMSLMTPLRC